MNTSIRGLLHRMPRIRRLAKDLGTALRGEPRITYDDICDGDLLRLIGKDDPTILDIGSNDGSHTLWFLKLFRNARVFSFEPDPRARERYRSKVNDQRAVLLDIAISDKDGFTDFYVSSGRPPGSKDQSSTLPEDWDLSGSIRKPKEHLSAFPWIKFEEKIVVRTMKLDSWVEEAAIREIDFIWADVQGAERDLIAGGTSALMNTRYFFTEYSNTEFYEGQVNLKQLLKLVPSFGVIRRYEHDVLLKNTRFV